MGRTNWCGIFFGEHAFDISISYLKRGFTIYFSFVRLVGEWQLFWICLGFAYVLCFYAVLLSLYFVLLKLFFIYNNFFSPSGYFLLKIFILLPIPFFLLSERKACIISYLLSYKRLLVFTHFVFISGVWVNLLWFVFLHKTLSHYVFVFLFFLFLVYSFCLVLRQYGNHFTPLFGRRNIAIIISGVDYGTKKDTRERKIW